MQLKLRGKFIALHAYIRKEENCWISNLTPNFQKTRKRRAKKKSKASKRKEITLIKANINKIEEKIETINEVQSWFFKTIKLTFRVKNIKREKAYLQHEEQNRRSYNHWKCIKGILWATVHWNSEEIGQFLKKKKPRLPKVHQDEDLDNILTINDIYFIIWNCPKRNLQIQMILLGCLANI